ncbi:hypothetical protein M422DRAFT_24904 [Sphaerobolus stellatus SS14]|nr:hypothetical protein M422DRAFT_24904 [Sphaerobolus stellatus SS14]
MSKSLHYTSFLAIEKTNAELRSSFKAGKASSIAFRKQQLLQMAYMFQDNLEAFQESFYKDLGRPKLEATIMDIGVLIGDALFAYKNLDKWAKPQKAPYDPTYSVFNPTVHREPKGVVLIIGPYNYPLYCIGAMAGAIAAGCAMVVKPSELCPATANLLAELFPKYLDQSLYRIINGGIEETTKVLTLKWDHILYTGSGRVGRIVATAAAKHLTPVSLELGGKSPALVHSSANFEVACRRLLWGKMVNAGQTCLAPDYIVVLKEDKDRFTETILRICKEFYNDDPRNSNSFGRLRAGTHFERVNGLLKRTKGKIIYGGDTDPEDKYIAPTIVVDVDWDDALMEEEIFGPIVPIISVSNFDVALDYVRDHDEPLAMYPFHNDTKFRDYVRANTLSGVFMENDTIIACASLISPLGGVGGSGTGSYKGEYSFLTFTHLRSSYESPAWLDSAVGMKARYPPYTDRQYEKAKALFVQTIPYARPGEPSYWSPRQWSFVAAFLNIWNSSRK